MGAPYGRNRMEVPDEPHEVLHEAAMIPDAVSGVDRNGPLEKTAQFVDVVNRRVVHVHNNKESVSPVGHGTMPEW